MKPGIGLTLLLLGSIAWAGNNDWPKVRKDCNQVTSPATPSRTDRPDPLWKRLMGCGVDFFTARPAHLTVKSVVPGGGTGLGMTSEEDFNHDRWQNKLTATGVSSFRAFWLTEVKFRATHDKFGDNNSARDRFAVDVYATARDLPHMVFFGIGPSTSRANITNFQERDVVAGVDVFNPFSSWLAAGGKLESIWPEVSGVDDPRLRSITTLFNESTAPGIAAQPNLIHYEAYLEPRRTRHKFQFDYKVGYNFYQDHDTGHYSFRRFRVDGLHTFHPFGRAEDVFTVRDRLTISDTSNTNVVPFYMQETLGGSNINGEPTLRGFVDYRFRGPDLTLIQAEYDHRVWGPLGLLGFYDAGQVANRAGDLSLAQMRHSFGFGMSFWAANKTWFKVYVGLGSGEGAHPYFGIPSF